jgi:flagellar hook protein FlgE
MMRTSLSGLQAASKDLNVTSNNLANGQTTAFKRSVAQFGDLRVGDQSSRPAVEFGQGVMTIAVQRQLQQGSFEASNSGLDVAISGNGYFTLGAGSANGDQTFNYTRSGHFSISNDGYLTNAEGLPVLGYKTAPLGSTTAAPQKIDLLMAAGGNFRNIKSVSIDGNGTVSVAKTDGSIVSAGTLALARFTNDSGLQEKSGVILKETNSSGPASYGAAGKSGYGAISQGVLETSNVDITQELLHMISAQQAYNGNSRALQTESEMLRSVAETLIR